VKKTILALLFAVAALIANTPAADIPAKHTFSIGEKDFLLDGRKFQIRCGEIHAARVPKEYWRQRLRMAKAMGLNTVCAYLFWNLHESQSGVFDWNGQADDAEFCRIAQQEGLWVILRPGPYSCAEWEMGGTPWWMLKEKDIQLRTRDPRYLAAANKYLKEVGRVLGPLQITQGGPIVMVQVENEYGSYGNDVEYVGAIRQGLLDAGFEVPLFACNPPEAMKNGLRNDLFQAANFGKEPEKNFKLTREYQKTGPLICSEFYPGWFDTWGEPHHNGLVHPYLDDLKYMLDTGASFSIYMAHGGTTFGLWAGCDQPFKPDISSYDYDAPISEAGRTTPKFFRTRDLLAKYLQPGETLPDPPALNPLISFAPVELIECAGVFDNLPSALKDETPRAMEQYDQGYGCILYRTNIPAGVAGELKATAVHDFGFVFLDGKRVGVLDRRCPNALITLPARDRVSRLDILVEPMGRINFGHDMIDPKGLIAPVQFEGKPLKGWEVFRLPLDDKMLAGLTFQKQPPSGPAFWRGTFTLEKVGDTFLDLRGWGKGDVWVNGHCLGRFWNIGPTQTAYTPGCWLRTGSNEVVILDLSGPEHPVVAGLGNPVLDEMHPEKDFTKSLRPSVK